MYRTNCLELRKNNRALQLIHEPGMNIHIHWLNPLLLKRKRQ